MKFSHSIQFNSVPDWADHYLAYSNLKKLIYQIERDIVACSIIAAGDTLIASDSEESPLLDAKTRANAIFIPALDKELAKINSFYLSKEKEFLEEVEILIADYAVFENLEDNVSIHSNAFNLSRSNQSGEGSNSRKRVSSRRTRSTSDAAVSFMSSDDDEAENHFSHPTGGSRVSTEVDFSDNRLSYLWTPSSLDNQKIRLKKRTIELFVWLSELKSFVSLNYTGFSKILKKYDKITNSRLKSSYLNNVVNESYPFRHPTRQRLEEKILKVQEIYANLCTNANMDIAIRELKTHLREFIVWERNTIWRDIIGLERKSHAVGIKAPVTVDHSLEVTSKITTPFGNLNVSGTFWKNAIILSICVGVFVFLLDASFFKREEQRYCFAILIFASLLWATEVIPLFVTSLAVPLLVVCLRVLRDDHDNRLCANDAAKQIFQAMFSPVIMLLLGGFAIAGALSKYHIAKMMATFVLSKAGTKPSFVLLANMFVATFASMWISNVAAPVLCLSLIQPILRNLPPNSNFGRCLILGIALASNVGGMASPISSPQNIIAIGIMERSPPSWIQWFFIAIPLCILVDLLTWLLLVWNYEPTKNSSIIHPIRSSKDPWTGTQIFVIIVTVTTILLWCVEKKLEAFFGDMGVIAIVPLVLFFGSGILTKEDFNNFLWTVIILAMGGIALGRAVQSSGLLHTIAKSIQSMVGDLHPWQVLVIFSSLVLVVATFISHTVGALIILPIVFEIGVKLSDPHPNLLVMGSVLMCSSAMGLPISGFPNMNAIMMEDEMGVRYLTTIDFIKIGVPASILALITIVTVGYGLMSLPLIGY
ncbi:1871_t:CDS:2 [Funneliformis geosporum]|uniref:13514_t:CDS:1 n=1 Tax=Funneliformis geosporum TaxID=1117311 RepID=A0A9W4SFE2_9GLOM|nr:13514_t:CDS:2 [Funneliformis geosporum]CAI2167803.1 1871_t:CDS:2 [Funneliformis geosporum]